jgi:hypothetical protein
LARLTIVSMRSDLLALLTAGKAPVRLAVGEGANLPLWHGLP